MAEDRPPKVEFVLDVPKRIKLRFDEPKTGDGQYGPWYLYGVEEDSAQKSLFLSEAAYYQVKALNAKKGTVLEITQRAKKNDIGKLIQVLEISLATGTQETEAPPTEKPDISVQAYVAQWVAIARELEKQWPGLHDKDNALFQSGVATIYIQFHRNICGR